MSHPPGHTASPFAVNTYSYTQDFSVRNCVARLANLGFRAFELMIYPGHLWPAHTNASERRELRQFLAGEGIRVTTLNMPNIDLNIAAATSEMREMTLGILRQVVALAGDLGAEGIVIGTGKANPLFPMPKEKLTAHFYEALDALVPLAANAGTAILVENMPFGFIPRMADVLTALDQYGDARVGVVYDVANGHFVREDICAAIRLCGKRLRAVHLSDTDQVNYRHEAVGKGTVDFSGIPTALKGLGFKREPILEIISPGLDDAILESARRLEGLWT